MKMKYFRRLAVYALLVVAFAFWFGFAGPWCISSRADELVLGWAFLTLVLVVLGLSFVAQKLNSHFHRATKRENDRENS
jgi:Zn-dependent protease with chaperone function